MPSLTVKLRRQSKLWRQSKLRWQSKTVVNRFKSMWIYLIIIAVAMFVANIRISRITKWKWILGTCLYTVVVIHVSCLLHDIINFLSSFLSLMSVTYSGSCSTSNTLPLQLTLTLSFILELSDQFIRLMWIVGIPSLTSSSTLCRELPLALSSKSIID